MADFARSDDPAVQAQLDRLDVLSPAGDRLGLQIVARLAARNGFGVRLDRSPAGGVTAAVRLPAGLLSAGAGVRSCAGTSWPGSSI